MRKAMTHCFLNGMETEVLLLTYDTRKILDRL